MFYRAEYRGRLVNGFFDCEILPPQGEILPDGSSRDWSWAPDMLDNSLPLTPGRLDGYVRHSSPPWNWIIPENAPSGEYTVYMRVYNHYTNGRMPPRRSIMQKEDNFIVG